MKKLTAYLFFLLLAASSAQAQTYNFVNYTVDDGLSQSQVLCMFQDSKGYLWFGTNSGGVSRYDGNKFVTFSDKEGLINNIVFSITEDKKGNLIFATSEGLSVFNGHHFTNYTDSSGLPHSRVLKVTNGINGEIWIGTKTGACKLMDGQLIPFKEDTLLNKSSVFSITCEKNGNVWFGTLNRGLFRYDPKGANGKTVKQFSTSNGLNNNMVRTLMDDGKGNVFAGTIMGLCKITGDSVKNITSTLGGDQVTVTSSYRDEKGDLWLGTSAGVMRISNGKANYFSERNGLVSNKILSILSDREGNTWFGTDGNGVCKLPSEAFVNYNIKDSLTDNYVNSIFQDSKKNMWIGTNASLVRIDPNKKVTPFLVDIKHPEKAIVGSIVQCTYEEKNGSIWFGTKTGLSIYDPEGKTFKNYSTKEGLLDQNIYSITADQNGTIWLGTRSGACFYTGQGFESFDQLEKAFGKESRAVYSIFCDTKNNLWFATDKGVMKYDHSTITHYNAKNGFTSKRVQSIVEDMRGNLWLGTDDGIFNYSNGKFIRIDDTRGLTSNKVYLLIPENEHLLWIGTNKGLDQLNLDSFNLRLAICVKHYGREEGFMGVECNSNARCMDDKGRLWFGTVKGATVYDPSKNKLNDQEAKTRISGIKLFFQLVDLSPFSNGEDSLTGLPIDLVLPYSKNHITFDLTGVSLSIPSKVKYSYMLEGIDKEWVPPTSRNEATYSSLPPGKYTFLLRASNNDGLWNKEPISFTFTILPPWYRTWWFYTLCVIIVGGSVYMYISVRTRNLEKAKIELEQEVSLRTFQLREEKEKVETINKEVVEQKTIIEAKNRDITDSILYAKNIQEAILPPLTNFYSEFKDSFVLYLPKDIVSGDFYWFAKRKNKRFIAAADCTGHGVPGAFMSIIGNALLNEIVTEKEILEPAAILNELHNGVKIALKQTNAQSGRRDGMDIALCAVTLPPSGDGAGILEFAGANRALWLFKKSGNGTLEVIKPNKFPIGGLELENRSDFTNHTIDVQKGDVIYIFSDGFADQFGGEKGKKYMVRNFEKTLASIYTKPLDEQVAILEQNFYQWKAAHEQVDDVLVIGFRI